MARAGKLEWQQRHVAVSQYLFCRVTQGRKLRNMPLYEFGEVHEFWHAQSKDLEQCYVCCANSMPRLANCCGHFCYGDRHVLVSDCRIQTCCCHGVCGELASSCDKHWICCFQIEGCVALDRFYDAQSFSLTFYLLESFILKHNTTQASIKDLHQQHNNSACTTA